LPIAFLGVLFLCLWKGRGRWLGLPLALAAMVWPRAAAPDVWIGDGGTNAASREGGQAVVLRPGVRQFPTDLWTQRRGLEAVEPAPDSLACARYGCRPVQAGVLALSWGRRALEPAAIAEMCVAAEVVSLRSHAPELPVECRGR